MKNRMLLASLLILLIITSVLYASYGMSMWQSALRSSKDASIPLGTFVEVSQWLAERLEQDEFAVVPFSVVFTVLNPELRDKLVDYDSIWHSAGVKMGERGEPGRMQVLRGYFMDFLQGNWSIRYVVRDWGHPYVRSLFDAPVSDELMFLLREVKVVPFTLSSGWSSKITIYEIVRYTTLFSIGFSYPPKSYSTDPSNVRIQYTWSGATIEKLVSRVGFYLPLEAGISASRQNYLTMQIKPDLEDLFLLMAFYFDGNGNGKWDGYNSADYVKTVVFDQAKLGWVRGEWYTIYQILPTPDFPDNPIVQIGIVATGKKYGAITISNLIVYMEITSEDVLIEASNWLGENLRDDEFALVPTPALFTYSNPELRPNLVDYRSIWAAAGVTLQANTTEVLKVRRHFIDYFEGNSSVKFIVRDWISPYAERLFEALVSDELIFLLREVKALFYTLGGGWSRSMRIYEVVRYTTLLSMNFSSAPKQYEIDPRNASVSFNSNGVRIEKLGSRVAFYVHLESGINASVQSYLVLPIKLDVEDLGLMISFYFDGNGNGKWDGYYLVINNRTDYSKMPLIFDQAKLGWVRGEWYTIYEILPKPDYPDDLLVQIGIIATGLKDGAITISSFTVHTEI